MVWRWDERSLAAYCVALSTASSATRAGVVHFLEAAQGEGAPEPPPLAWISLDCAFTRALVLAVLQRRPGWRVRCAASPEETCPEEASFCWAEYERVPFDRLLAGALHASCFVVRKGLCRKAQLAMHCAQYSAKRPDSALASAVPQTLLFEFWDAEYIDEALAEVFEVRDMATDGSEAWILKPSLTNQAAGIVVFDRVDTLVAALQAEGAEDVREWVLQRYIRNPLLVGGCKFHLRAYVVAVGALSAYLLTDVLALYSLSPYDPHDLSATGAHLTNTCRQSPGNADEEARAVGLLADLPDRLRAGGDASLSEAEGATRIARVLADAASIIGGAFEAVSTQLSYLPLPNAFEIYGVDLLIDETWKVWLLEFNAQPDFVQTGDRLARVPAAAVEQAVALAVDAWFPSAVAAAAAPHAAGGGDAHAALLASQRVLVYERLDPRAAGGRMTFA